MLFDSVAFAYFLDPNPAYYLRAEELFGRIAAGRITGISSTLVLTELLVPYYQRGGGNAPALSATVRSYPKLEWVEVGASIAERAARLRATYNLRTPDAVHVATGLERHAGWFVTNDPRLRRVEREGIRVWLFDELAIPPT
ncbi:hypothetical protein BH23GEM3_BH23GEM3_21770 [soil metagenome]